MSWWHRLATEAHRRSLWQVLGMYLVGSWVGFQVVLSLVQGIGLPEWLPRAAAVLFLVGLPIVLVTAFVQGGLRSQAAPRGHDVLDPTLFPDVVEPAAARAPAGSRLQRLRAVLTWRRALLGGLAAFVVLGALTGGWLALRAMGIGPMASLVAAEQLDRNDRILIADFTARNADTALAAVVSDAFRIDFARSTLVRAVAPSEVRDVLQRMGFMELPRLDAELVQQLAVRDGIPAYITGEIAGAGSGYVLTARLIAADSGKVLVALREKASDEDGLIDAIDRLSRALRERTGESLRTIRRAEPLAQVTTASLEALRYYTQAHRLSNWEGNPERARELHEEAVRLDSTFAAAHAALAVYWFNRDETDQGMAAAERALRFSERLGEFERARIQSVYHLARQDFREAVRTLERVLALDPRNHAALNNLGLAHAALGDTAAADSYYRRAIAADTGRFFGYANHGESLVMQGRLAEAEQAFTEAVTRAPTSAWPLVLRAQLPYVAGRSEEAQQRLEKLIADPELPLAVKQRAGEAYTQILRVHGRYREADARTAAAVPAGGEAQREQAWQLLDSVLYDVLVFDRRDRAVQNLPQLRALVPRVEDSDLPLWLAVACGLLGDAGCARTALAGSAAAGKLEPWSSLEARMAHAGLARAEGRHQEALRIYRSSDRSCVNCTLPFIGQTLEELQQPDSAAAVFERFIRSTSIDRLWADAQLAPIHEWLAAYYEQRGERNVAARHYGRLIELWQDADPELQPRVAAARRRLAALLPDA